MELAFYFSSLVAVLATLRVIMHTQPIHALMYLVISFLAIACVFFSLGAYFTGALEIIVYAGAIMVLFVFVVMMLNVGGISGNKIERVWLQPRVWIGPSLMSLVLLMILVHALVSSSDRCIIGQMIAAKTVGIALFGQYMLAVELASMLLLAGLVVAFHLGRDKRDNVNALYNEGRTKDY